MLAFNFDFVGLMNNGSFFPLLADGGLIIEFMLANTNQCFKSDKPITYSISDCYLVHDIVLPPPEYTEAFVSQLTSEDGVAFHYQTFNHHLFASNSKDLEITIPEHASSIQALYIIPRVQSNVSKLDEWSLSEVFNDNTTDVGGTIHGLVSSQLRIGTEYVPVQPMVAHLITHDNLSSYQYDEFYQELVQAVANRMSAGLSRFEYDGSDKLTNYITTMNLENTSSDATAIKALTFTSTDVTKDMGVMNRFFYAFNLSIVNDLLSGTNTMGGVGDMFLDIKYAVAPTSTIQYDTYSLVDNIAHFFMGMVVRTQ
jgi:hypothetical protein